MHCVDLGESFPASIYLQKSASIQPRTSPIKFAHLTEKSEKGSISNLSTKVASTSLEKIGFKRICEKVGAPTPPFRVLADEDFTVNLANPDVKKRTVKEFRDSVLAMNLSEPGLIKSIHGGGLS